MCSSPPSARAPDQAGSGLGAPARPLPPAVHGAHPGDLNAEAASQPGHDPPTRPKPAWSAPATCPPACTPTWPAP
jgi:hypothetical protein